MTLAPTRTDLVCAAIIALLQDRPTGVFQFTGPRDVSYADVGRFLATYCNADPLLVKETSARSAGLPEGSTPANTTLDSTTLRERYGLAAPDVWEVIAQLAATAKNASDWPPALQ
jgi:dTDP-4-dehydrorhamnose reductase